MTSEKLADIATAEIAKAAPPLAVLGATVGGFALQDWVFIMTLVYIVLQAGWLVWKWWKAASTKGWQPND